VGEFEVAVKILQVLFCHMNRDKGKKAASFRNLGLNPLVTRLIARKKVMKYSGGGNVDLEPAMIFHIIRYNNNNNNNNNNNE
jgi:hypothetical protein